MIIYIAGKYSAPSWGERTRNTHIAIDAGIEIIKKGHYPVIPHLTHHIDERMDYNGEDPRPKEYWYALDNRIIPKCDAFIQISSSQGADNEFKLAKELGLKIFKTLEEIPSCMDGDCLIHGDKK